MTVAIITQTLEFKESNVQINHIINISISKVATLPNVKLNISFTIFLSFDLKTNTLLVTYAKITAPIQEIITAVCNSIGLDASNMVNNKAYFIPKDTIVVRIPTIK